jgi:hypothetical protein
MNCRSVSTALFAICLAAAVAGCQKSADEQAQQAAPLSPDTSSTSKSAVSKQAAPARKPIVVPADTEIAVVLDEPLGSKTSTTGQSFSATLANPIEAEGKVAIPKGARAAGIVKDAKAAGRFKGGAVLALELTSVTVDGKNYEIQTSAPTLTSKGKGKRTATMIGGGAAGGALIGGLAGGGKGAGIGALIGAAAGTGGAAFTGKRDIVLAAETPLTFKLLQPLELKSKP